MLRSPCGSSLPPAFAYPLPCARAEAVGPKPTCASGKTFVELPRLPPACRHDRGIGGDGRLVGVQRLRQRSARGTRPLPHARCTARGALLASAWQIANTLALCCDTDLSARPRSNSRTGIDLSVAF